MIDWHEFVVVETIDFFEEEDEDLPAPLTLNEVVEQMRKSDLGPEEVAEEAGAYTRPLLSSTCAISDTSTRPKHPLILPDTP